MNQSLHEREISWALERLPLVEHANLLAMTEWELLDHALSQQRELQAVRALTRAAIERIHQLTHELEQQRRQSARLRDEYRELRVTAA